jgi:hypothetical protein
MLGFLLYVKEKETGELWYNILKISSAKLQMTKIIQKDFLLSFD